MSFNEGERQSAHSQVFHIQNANGVFGNLSNSTVTIYDYSSIHQLLKDHNLPQTERNELENVMDELKNADPAAKPQLVERAKAWITRNADFIGASVSIIKRALGLQE